MLRSPSRSASHSPGSHRAECGATGLECARERSRERLDQMLTQAIVEPNEHPIARILHRVARQRLQHGRAIPEGL